MLLKTILSFQLLFITMLCAHGQGIFSGKIYDLEGNAMYGVVVVDTNDYSISTQSDFDGLFRLKVNDKEKHIFKFVLLGYSELTDSLSLVNGENIYREYVITEKSMLANEVQIQAKAIRSTDNYMDKIKMNSVNSIDFVTSETIKKAGDSNVLSAVARVSGVSTSGGLITIRGIGDRYVKTMLNGSRIPTLDPLTNNIKLDIFPAALVDNIILTKTASADLPGDWSGAYLSVETKDYPEQLTVQVESQIGYNAQSTFKDIISSERSQTDWLGFDGGLRSRTGNQVSAPNLTPGSYQEMVALGLGDYFGSLGINGWTDGNALADNYFRLGLVELGLLPPALMNDQTAYQEALAQYNATYKPRAYRVINPNNVDYNSGFSNNWTTKFMKAPLSFTQNLAIGDQKTIWGKPFGYFIGIRYGNSFRYDPYGLSQRIFDESRNYGIETSDETLISRETNSWSALVNLAYQLNTNNKISFLFMPNQIGTNDVAAFTNIPISANGIVQDQEIQARRNIFYEQRRQFVYQLSTQHFLPSSRIKIDFNASYTDGASVAPDFRTTEYGITYFNQQIVGYTFYPTVGDGIRRFYRYLDENLLDTRLSLEIPLSQSNSSNTLKIGVSELYNYRKIDNEEYRVMLGNGPVPIIDSDDIDGYMIPDRFIMRDSLIDFYYLSLDEDRNHSFGHSRVDAGFGMINYNLSESLKLNSGVRIEHTDIYTDVDKFDQLGYVRDDPRRSNVTNFPNVNPAEMDRWDWLPSIGLIYKIESVKTGRSNVRLNYSKTIARPSIRELNDAALPDNEFRQFIYGNSDLQPAITHNFDIRLEDYFNNGDQISVSLFYKRFQNHIEMGFGNVGITWENIPRSTVQGIELEGKKKLGRAFEFRGNVTLVKSASEFIRKDFSIQDGQKFYLPIDTIQRPMFGQAPYLVNAMLSYKSDTLGLTATLSYNVQGERLVIAGAFKGWADVYEMPRHLVDFKLSKRLGGRFTASLTVRDILNSPVLRSYDLPDGWFTFDRFRYGTTFILGVSYKY